MGFLDRTLGPGDRDAFAAEVLRLLRRASPSKTLTYDAADFSIRIGKDDGIVNLGNVWAQVEHASRFARAAAARRFVAAMGGADRPRIPERWEDAAPLLLPRLRPRVWHHLIALQAKARGIESFPIAHEPLGEHYAVELVCDFPESCSSVPQEKLDAWGKTFADVMMTATRNLRSRPPKAVAEMRGKDGVGVVLIVMSGDTYDASRMVVMDMVLKQADKSFDPVVIPAHRDVLLVGDADDPASLVLLAEIAGREFDKVYPIACVPLRRSFGEWTPWLPATGHPARDALAKLVRRSLDRDYADQAQALQAAEGEQIYVANQLLVNGGKPDERRVVVWTEGVPTWIPRTEFVVLGRNGAGDAFKQVATVKWDRLVEISGASMKPLDMWPPRWEVRDFPDEATMNRLIAASQEL